MTRAPASDTAATYMAARGRSLNNTVLGQPKSNSDATRWGWRMSSRTSELRDPYHLRRLGRSPTVEHKVSSAQGTRVGTGGNAEETTLVSDRYAQFQM